MILHPIIHHALIDLLIREFNLTPNAAASTATKMLKALAERDLEIVRRGWLERAEASGDPWDRAAGLIDEWVQLGVKPWEIH